RLLDELASSAPARHRWTGRAPRVLLAATLVAGASAVASPALGGPSVVRIVRALTGSAPPSVREDFHDLDEQSPDGMAPHAIVGRTTEVFGARSRYGTLAIWATPTRGGALCVSETLPGEPDPRPHVVGCEPGDPTETIRVGFNVMPGVYPRPGLLQ